MSESQVIPPPAAVRIRLDGLQLHGDLTVPDQAKGVVLFVHGAGGDRRSERNKAVARALQHAGFATLLFDLVAATEEGEVKARRAGHYDVDRHIGRLVAVTDWARREAATFGLDVGYFGAGEGAAAALGAAAERPEVKAVVSRGGRPDLTPDASLFHVVAPTLLIVGGEDRMVLSSNRRTMARMAGPATLEVVLGASHRFDEPGALDRVARLTCDWFAGHLCTRPALRSS